MLAWNKPPDHSLRSRSFTLQTPVCSIEIQPQHDSTLRTLSQMRVVTLDNLSRIVNTLSFDCSQRLIDNCKHILSRKQWRALTFTMYKRKGKKIHPRNIPLPGGKTPGGGLNQRLEELVAWKIGDGIVGSGKGKTVPRGSRLTPERLEAMNIGGGTLWKKEVEMFHEILFEKEGAIAFSDEEMGLLNPEIEPPVEIHTVPHDPWQQQNLRLPKAMQDEANRIIRSNLKAGNYEFSQGPYRGRYFLVEKKKPGTWRLVNDIQPLNGVTIRDSGMPPSVDEFSEDFAGYPITSAIDYYSGYYQIPLDEASRDLTAFLTLLGLLRLTRLPQGWTNSVAIFQRVMGKVHWRQIPEFVRPFLDDVGIKGPRTRYNDEEIFPGIRRYVYEHALIFRQFLHDAWLAGLTISGTKSMIAMPGVDIVGFLCDIHGRRPEPGKIQKILDWPTPTSTKQARGFIGLAVYYRIFIRDFSLIAAPIFDLFRKGRRFDWTPECQIARENLCKALTTAPVLISLDYSPSALGIVLQTDASTIGWGGVLAQYQEDGLHPARFESGIWSDAEKKYDAVRLECRGLLKLLKKFRFWVYGRHFFIQTDSRTLVWILNQPPNDLPNAMMTRWLSYIRLFDFDVEHINGKKNGAADGLSRRGLGPGEEKEEEDPDDFFEHKVGNISAGTWSSRLNSRIFLVETEYMGDDLVLGEYLETLRRPQGFSDSQFQQLRKRSRQFFIRDGYLFKRGRKRGIPARRVIGLPEQREEAIRELHDEIGHRGVQVTFEHLARRYQWKGMYEDVAKWIKTCEICQKRARNRMEEPLHPTWTTTVWEKVGVDVVYMPWEADGYGFIVFARDDLSGWVEGKPLKNADSRGVAKFLYEDVICRHGCPRRMVMDGGSENLDLTKALLEDYKIKRMVISPYHPQANGLVERGHAPIVNSLAKLCRQLNTGNWMQFLPLALWADRISVRRPTGYSAFEMVYGRDCLLPVEFSIASWSTVDWDISDREDLILARMQQLNQLTLSRSQAAENLMNSRKGNKAYFDKNHALRQEKLQVGDLVLRFNWQDAKSRSRATKLADNWRGPYRVYEAPEDSTFYRLEELDGVKLQGTFAGDGLKRFFSRQELQEDCMKRAQVLKEIDDAIETDQRLFAERNKERLTELQEMAERAKLV